MKAVRIQSAGKASVVPDAPVPALRPGTILVKVMSVALNPTDWKHIASINSPVAVGCDYAGIVVDVSTAPPDSPDVKESAIIKTWRKGDRVFGVIHGANPTRPEDGSFAEYLLAPGALQMKIPDGMTFDEAASLGMGVSTVGQGFQAMGLPIPFPGAQVKEGSKILVYGGSSAMGAYGIQLFKR
jgi:NADPH:quinone reductase-like Zn-dependent oxidoreductase